MVHRSRRKASFLLTIGLVIGFGFLGYLSAGWLIEAISKGLFAHWTSLGTPPGKAVLILAYDSVASNNGKTVVRTTDGKFFQYKPGLFPRWVETTWPYSIKAEAQPFCPTGYYIPLPVLAYAVVDCVGWYSWEWSSFEEYYAVLTDGSVWYWHYGMTFLGNLLICGGGPLLGMISGYLISRLARYLTHQAPKSQ